MVFWNEICLLKRNIMRGENVSLQYSKSHHLLGQALSYRTQRQDMIAGNIANIDTPFYRSRDINFEDTLKAEARKLHQERSYELQMAKTDNAHLEPYMDYDPSKPTLFFRDGHMARNDGNTVDLDIETTELGKNSIMINALTYANKKNGAIFKSVIEASGKT